MSNRLPAERRRQQLLDVARSVFAVNEFHRTSMNEVADRAGVTKPVLYQHFESKRRLYLELLVDIRQRLIEAISEAVAVASTPREQVEMGFGAYFRFVIQDQDSFRVLFGGGTRSDPEFNAEALRAAGAVAAMIAELIQTEGLSGADRLLLAHGVVGMAEETSRHWITDGESNFRSADDLAALVADLAWRGLRGAGT